MKPLDLSKIPPKPPGEDPITEKQCQFILSLDESLREDAVRKLGKWQARAVIKALLDEEKRGGMDEDEYEEDEDFGPMPREKKKKSGCGCLALSLLGGIGFLAMLIAPNIAGISKSSKEAADARNLTTPRPTATPTATARTIAATTPAPTSTPQPAPTATPTPTPFVPRRLKVEVAARLEYGITRLKKGTPVEVIGEDAGGWTVRAKGVEFHVSREQVE